MNDRSKLLGLIWLLQFVNHLDRVNISVAAPSMMKSLSIDPGTFGFVVSAFTVGYAIMQILGGAWRTAMTRPGSRPAIGR